MSPMPWFRVYSEILDDRKLKRISKKTGQSKALIIGVWISLLALANKSIERGKLMISEDLPYSIDDLEDETGLPQEIIGQLLDEFRIMGMISGNITIEISNWSKRQFKSDDVSKRVRRFREHQREEPHDETLQKRSGIVIDTESDKESESDKEKEELPVLPNIFKFYDENIGPLTQNTADELMELEDKFGEGIVIEAIKEADNHQARNMAYIKTVANSLFTNGKRKGKRGSRTKPDRDPKSYISGQFAEYIEH